MLQHNLMMLMTAKQLHVILDKNTVGNFRNQI